MSELSVEMSSFALRFYLFESYFLSVAKGLLILFIFSKKNPLFIISIVFLFSIYFGSDIYYFLPSANFLVSEV